MSLDDGTSTATHILHKLSICKHNEVVEYIMYTHIRQLSTNKIQNIGMSNNKQQRYSMLRYNTRGNSAVQATCPCAMRLL